MSKKNPEQLLREFVEDAVRKDGLIDSDTLNFDKQREILDNKLYDEGIDWGLLWYVLFNQLLKFHDWENKNKVFTNEEKDKFVRSTHKFLSGVPFEYDFYFKLPDGYPLDPEKFSKSISIIKSDQGFVDSQEEINPIAASDKLIFRKNPKILEQDKTYLLIKDKGLVMTVVDAFLESSYSPDRVFGIFLAVHLVTGCLKTDKLTRDNSTPRVYDISGKYRANFVSPIRSSKAEHLEFRDDKDPVKTANKVFMKLMTHQNNKDLESARVQLCNSLYWYIEFLNSVETSLQLVFLVSAFDSLFPPRKHSVYKGKDITPAGPEKALIIADVSSENQNELKDYIETIEKLFEERNRVIHGKVEIHGYRKSAKKQNTESIALVTKSTQIYEKYLKKRILKFVP